MLSGRRGSHPRKLVVTEGPLSGTSLPLRSQGTLIGRSPECALVLDDDYASGRHARIFEQEGRWLVEDLGSTNGTFVDNRRITAPTPLELGTTLRIGRTVVELAR
jgi:pSer/pThr/pTyr-binding forkhead associated (FHA) protein